MDKLKKRNIQRNSIPGHSKPIEQKCHFNTHNFISFYQSINYFIKINTHF